MPARAEGGEAELGEALGVPELEEAAGLEDYGSVLGGLDAAEAVADSFRSARKAGALALPLRQSGSLFLIALLCSTARQLLPESRAGERAILLAGSAAMAVCFCGVGNSLLEEGTEAIGKLQDVGNALLPVLGGAALLSGQVTAAAAKYTGAAFFLNILSTLSCRLVVPLIRIYAAAAVGEAVSDNGVLTGLLGVLKWGVTTLLTVLVLAFTVFLSLSGLTANTADAALVRSAKTAVSTLLPVVGGIASDAAGSILSAAAVIRNAVGYFGLAAVAVVLAAPFLQVGLSFLCTKAAAALSAGLVEGTLARLLKRFGEGAALLLGCLGALSLLLFFSVYTMIGVTIP